MKCFTYLLFVASLLIMLHGWCWKRGTTVTVNIIKQQFITVPARYSSSVVNGEENSTRYIPSAASQVFENMDDRDKWNVPFIVSCLDMR